MPAVSDQGRGVPAAAREVMVRAATQADLGSIAAIAIATGQVEEWTGSDPSYLRYMLHHGRVVVAVLGENLAGFGISQQIGHGAAAATMLCDLFVDPAVHGSGCGRAILTELWAGSPRRLTFSSLHSNAMPLYTSFGLDAWWPLPYLRGDVRAVQVAGNWTVTAATADEVGRLEQEWTGTDRTADHRV